MTTNQGWAVRALMAAALSITAGCGGGGGGTTPEAPSQAPAPAASVPSPPLTPTDPVVQAPAEWNIGLSLDTGRSISRLQFISTTHGFVTGVSERTESGSSIYSPWGIYTHDGGSSWSDITFPSGASGGKDLFFVDGQTGWLVVAGRSVTNVGGSFVFSQADRIFKTVDGGQHWTETGRPLDPSASSELSVRNLYFKDENQGWLSSDSGLFRTDDGGTAWAKVGNVSPPRALKFTSDTGGWGLTSTNGVMRTSNGGSSWAVTKVGGTVVVGSDTLDVVESIWNGYFLDDQRAWVVAQPKWTTGSTTNLYRTTDGGSTWVGLNAPAFFSGGLHFTSAQQGWALGSAGALYRTQDGGSSWVQVAKSSTLTRGTGQLIMTSPTTAWSIGLVDGPNPFSPDQQLRRVTLP